MKCRRKLSLISFQCWPQILSGEQINVIILTILKIKKTHETVREANDTSYSRLQLDKCAPTYKTNYHSDPNDKKYLLILHNLIYTSSSNKVQVVYFVLPLGLILNRCLLHVPTIPNIKLEINWGKVKRSSCRTSRTPCVYCCLIYQQENSKRFILNKSKLKENCENFWDRFYAEWIWIYDGVTNVNIFWNMVLWNSACEPLFSLHLHINRNQNNLKVRYV